MSVLTAHRRRLVHDPARHSNEVVLGPPGDNGQVHRRHIDTSQGAQGGGDAAFEGGRGGQPSPDRDVAVDQQLSPRDGVTGRFQRQGDGRRVRGPASGEGGAPELDRNRSGAFAIALMGRAHHQRPVGAGSHESTG